MVFDIDGTREAARQRALPKGEDLPPAFRRLDDICAPGYRGRKRGEVVRTRTTVSQAVNAGRFAGQDFALQPDGTLRCPANQTLTPHEQRREADGSLRIVYEASIHSCRLCPLREQCQWNGRGTKKPRQVSVLLHPLDVGEKPLLWFDWSRRVHRQACIHLLRSQRVEIQVPAEDGTNTAAPPGPPRPLSRAARAHVRLTWASRFARNVRKRAAKPVTIRLCGVPEAFATFLGLSTA